MNILDPQGPIGAAEKTILIDSVGDHAGDRGADNHRDFRLRLLVPAIEPARASICPDWADSGRIELVVWSIPALTVILLGGVAWIGAHQLDPAKPVEGTGQAITIQVVSLDWKWLFIYPDQRIATVNTLTVPVGAPLHFQLTSASVMNAFFIPQFGSMIYTMNGMTTRLELRADEVGTYQGLSAHFSGDGFPDMMFDVHVVPQNEFSDWATKTAHGDNALNADELQANSSSSRCQRTRRSIGWPIRNCSRTSRPRRIAPGPGPELTREDRSQRCSVS